MKKFRFREWPVYIDSQNLFSAILEIVKKLPREHQYSLGNQISRSSLSIILNIAEGSEKTSDKELNRFLEIALGSIYETVACIDVLEQNTLISAEKAADLRDKLDHISNQLGGFKKKILLEKS